MIIALLGSKGGTGKTLSALTLLSAIAEHNSTAGKGGKIRTAAVDTDKQKSLMKFAENREATGRPNYDIAFKEIDEGEDAVEVLQSLDSQSDLVIVDIPGHFSDEHLKIALTADRIIIPTNLETIEIQEMISVSNHLEELIDRGYFRGEYATLLAKVPAATGFSTKFNRAIVTRIREGGYQILSATLPQRPSIPNIVNYASYLFEQVADNPKAKSPQNAAADAKAFLQSVLEWKVLPDLEAEREADEEIKAADDTLKEKA